MFLILNNEVFCVWLIWELFLHTDVRICKNWSNYDDNLDVTRILQNVKNDRFILV